VQDVGDVVIRRLSRVEGAEYHNTTSTIEIGADTNIRSLTLEDVKQKIPDAKTLLKIADTARIGRLTR